MVSTRLAPPDIHARICADRRNRVDPSKLLALIQRIRNSGGGHKPALTAHDPRQSVKAG